MLFVLVEKCGLIDSEEYKQVFPDVSSKQDSKSAGRWETNKGGEAFFTLVLVVQ